MPYNKQLPQEQEKTGTSLDGETISVIICAYSYERWESLVVAVTSVQAQCLSAQEIVIVIDHNDQLLQKAQAYFSTCRVISNTEGSGLSGARNTGLAAAHGTLLAFLDDDAQAEQDWLLQMHTALQDTRALGVGSAVLPDWEGEWPFWFPPEFYWVVGCTYRGMPRTNAPIRNPVGASMCIRREVFEEIGGFRSEIGRVGTVPVGCEETELCIRARQHWPERYFLYLPQVRVFHAVPRKRITWSYFCSRCYAEGLSKAVVSRFVGASSALSSESSYALVTLPGAVLWNLAAALFTWRVTYLTRALLIVLGLMITTTGYIIGKYSSKKVETNSA